MFQAINEKDARLVESLRRDLVKYKLRMTVLFARSVSMFAQNNEEAIAAARKGNDLKSRVEQSNFNVATLVKMKEEVTRLLEDCLPGTVAEVRVGA